MTGSSSPRAERAVGAGLAVFIVALVVVWSSGLPFRLGVAIYTEQMLIAVLGAAIALCFLAVPARRGAPARAAAPWYDRALAGVAFVFGLVFAWRFPVISQEAFFRPNEAMLLSVVGLVLIVEAIRRSVGYSLLVVLAVVCGYALFADVFQGALQNRAIAPNRLVTFLILDSAALAGAALTIAVAIVIPFVLLAKLLMATGGSAFFSDLSAGLMGRSRGGSAKIAIVGSSLFGSISGSAVSNVASTGGITIPLMKQGGYRPRTAGAIEAAASTGGQLMPPIMGASAFLLAENLQVAYTEVIVAALVPALLYYASLFIFADLEAGRRGIAPVPEDRIPALASVLRRGWFLVFPFAVLVIALFSFNLPPETAALAAIAVLVVLSAFVTYDGGRLTWRRAFDAVVATGRSAVEIILICALAGMIIGLFARSGLSFSLAFFLLQLGEVSLLLLLLVTGAVCILLGMGMPTIGVYLLLSALAAPPLIELGVEPMAAHLFVLYFGMMSMITPPVAIAAFVAANMAGAGPMRTGVEAVRIAWPAYVVPFLFAASPALLLAGGWTDNVLAALGAVAGVGLATVGVVGYALKPVGPAGRAAFVAAGLALLLPPALFPGAGLVNLAGLACGVALLAVQRGGVRQIARPSRGRPG